jgi:hypothetical protein
MAYVSRPEPEAASRSYGEYAETTQPSRNHLHQEFSATSSGESDRALDLAHLDVIGALART